MRFGFGLPQMGSVCGPEAIVSVAKRAEELGFDNLWVADRSLFPLNPRAPYPVGDGTLPELYKRALDPLETLTFVAAHTHRVGLGTSVLNLPWYSPVLLARRLTTLDVLSGGRLRVGLGIGWSPDEYEAAGIPWEERGERATEMLNALKTIWANDTVEFESRHYKIPKSIIGLKPLQKPRPPIYVAAYVPPAMKRVATEADGWFPVGVPLNAVQPMFEQIRGMAKDAGRNPEDVKLIIRANVEFSSEPIYEDRADFTGKLEQIAEDVQKTKEIGAEELLLDVQFSSGVRSVEDFLARMDQLWEIARSS